ncbi:MAG: NADP-dependent isocitrate dehydrogenase [Propionibacteriaceae bacterium]|nr:NADP-dependent isocitrate dehydrogenase [Propionibacteriaceae bacterium]
MPKIIYTLTDEAPMLATYSFKPIVEAFAATAGVDVDTRDISLGGRILAAFSDRLPEDQRVDDALAELGELTHSAKANIIKLPNISASVPQLKAAVAELQAQGFELPDYVDNPQTDEEKEIRARYDAVKGSAVNPVLREGNSDRRAPAAVKRYAQAHPHWMGEWDPESRTNVAHMKDDDFHGNEQTVVMTKDDDLRVQLVSPLGKIQVLKESIPVKAGDVVDSTFMSVSSLKAFLRRQIRRARQEDVLFSVHLKATMMKVSDPIMFGHVIRVFFADVYNEYGAAMDAAGLNPNNGLASIFEGLEEMDEGAQIRAAFDDVMAKGPRLAMVNSDKGITNLHVPSDVIVDASMPAMIRNSGHMWGPSGEEEDTLAVLPDSSYGEVYQAVIEDCRENGALDPRTMGSVANVGLMAQKAEEYGSHDKTFEIPFHGTIQVVNSDGQVIMDDLVDPGDIWRACTTTDAAIRDWVKLAVTRARATGDSTVFWLDRSRAHDRVLKRIVRRYLGEHDTEGLRILFMHPADACEHALFRMRKGLNTISVTGNVLRDYNTDLFPILELGTSAKMLSVVPLMAGGGLFETGAGGSAPKHVQQLIDENYLRWDSLGEFLALAESLRHLAEHNDNAGAAVLGDALDKATEKLLLENKSPARKLGQIDNRGSHFWLTLYWAKELARQTTDPRLAEEFKPIAAALEDNAQKINEELIAVQGEAADIGGYYRPDPEKTAAVMRPSETLNEIIAQLG